MFILSVGGFVSPQIVMVYWVFLGMIVVGLGLFQGYVILVFYGGLMIVTFIIVIPNSFVGAFYMFSMSLFITTSISFKIGSIFVILLIILSVLV